MYGILPDGFGVGDAVPVVKNVDGGRTTSENITADVLL